MFTTTFKPTKIRFIPRHTRWDGTKVKSVWVKQTQLASDLYEEVLYQPNFVEQLLFFLYL